MKLLFGVVIAVFFWIFVSSPILAASPTWWDFQSIDTMKYSRDLSSELLNNPQRLQQLTDDQTKSIAETGATHVAIATPYDGKFLPVLTAWVAAARRHGLHVWFRGNWSGWEQWFDAQPISREDHLRLTVDFIKQNASLFENGDYFSACPECENGGPGDPRKTGDVEGHRKFLIDEYQAELKAFREINRNVQINLNSMNGDVARLVMDKETTKALGGQVVIDHYVATPEKLDSDIREIASSSGGRVLLGEFGAPIQDIQGNMTEQEQADWLKKTMNLLAKNPDLYGLSYWTNMGGSTALWHEDGSPKLAVGVLKSFYIPHILNGNVVNPLDQRISAQLQLGPKTISTVKGDYELPYLNDDGIVHVSANGYASEDFYVSELELHPTIELRPLSPGLLYRFQEWIEKFIDRIFS